ncbi:alpha-amylase [Clostridium sp. AM33-3]|uniref:alpha-amylase n=1 Tax=Clostridium sp. AM33-3 TaxID=2292304 RepID=UPI000E50B329|nr:alpha-amylase [Clostridium sp. AM33-3]RHT24143.1 alpha-amylase [Clostridium sp. AM33-3]
MEQYQIDVNDSRVYPMGLTRTDGGIHVSAVAAAKACSLLLFVKEDKNGKEARFREVRNIPFPEEGKTGHVWSMTLNGAFDDLYYAFEADGKRFSDPYGRSFAGRERWGRLSHAKRLLLSPVAEPEFDWQGDRPLHIPYEDCIVYRAHVRGLTKHASSGTEHRGTFRGVVDKIPYFKELGITTLELLPPVEFQEVMMPENVEGNPYGTSEPTSRLNYWGYAKAGMFAPKASYADPGTNPVTEFKYMVRELHKAGLEVVPELYFSGKEVPEFVLETVRFWVREYHVDGIHLTGYAPTVLLAKDPYLADTKLWALSWEAEKPAAGEKKHLGEYNDGFLIDMRRALKGDEEQMSSLIYRNRRNPAETGVLNFMAGTNGFTMMDMVSYDQKHNEANGENNRDGSDYNYSWNCGAEGHVRKKKIQELRSRQLRNAMLLLFLSQGTPVLLAGDEFGNSQNGNNNAYCQDNEISWLNWNLNKWDQALLDFVKHVIAFRKAHPVFHMEQEPRVMDYLACGHPDISYHGVNAWQPEFENFRRQIGILYCGAYAKKPNGENDDFFFVIFNMHWEPHSFALPNLPKNLVWSLAFDTSDSAAGGYYEEGQERQILNQKNYMVPSRSVLVFQGKKKAKNLDKA